MTPATGTLRDNTDKREIRLISSNADDVLEKAYVAIAQSTRRIMHSAASIRSAEQIVSSRWSVSATAGDCWG
jgi:hypothetical protein